MKKLSSDMIALALEKVDGVPMTNEEKEICEEWYSGQGRDNMKIETGDPKVLDYYRLWNKLENKKSAVWESMQAVESLSIPIQQNYMQDHSNTTLMVTPPLQRLWVKVGSFALQLMIVIDSCKQLFRKISK